MQHCNFIIIFVLPSFKTTTYSSCVSGVATKYIILYLSIPKIACKSEQRIGCCQQDNKNYDVALFCDHSKNAGKSEALQFKH